MNKARTLCSPTDYFRQALTAQYIAVLRIRQKQYTKADSWIAKAITEFNKSNLEERIYLRKWSSLLYYRAEISYHNGDYEQAEALYREDIEVDRSIDWQRGILYTQNWLANVAIAKNNLDEAENLLRQGLPVVERNKDQRRTAHYKRSFAHLERKRGNLDEALCWAEQALDGFERLGMYPEIEKMRALITTIQGDASPVTHLATSF